MVNQSADVPLKKTALWAGILYLVITVIAPFSMLYVPSVMVVAGDAAATAGKVMASPGLLRLAMAGDGLVFLLEIAITALLYTLFKPVNPTIALMAAFARLAMTVVQGFNVLNYFFVLLIFGGAAGFAPEQANGLGLLFLNAHEAVALIWGLFFGLHLLLIGYLVYKSGYIPRFVGIILVIVGVCYLVQSFGNILLPDDKGVFSAIGMIGIIEIVFPLWLVVKRPNPTPAGRLP